ncbi:serine/threonine-protein kinase H1-like [Clavelina lepadiformis]|uniref:serine/threonine-protein kinase H1-like n=1 Tax=Clavelina lepadiformis TaxID=159417 RepID=UPI0040411BD9
MGCGYSKILPEPPFEGKKDVQYVKSVDPYLKKGKASPGSKEAFLNSETEKEKLASANNNKAVAKYRAKVDPRVVAKYDIKALIGRGSFSKVVRVERKGSKQPYAIKMIDVKEKEGRDVCDSELRVLRRVRHEYIVQLIEVFEAPDKYYMVMELATGGELFDRIITKGSFSERDAVKVLQMVLQAVAYLHMLGITHRDLKPENLLYYHPGNDSKLLITDFGLASTRRSGEDGTMNTTCGTPEYIAPEVLLRKSYTSAVDDWAIGVITYILLSGMMPFDDENKGRLYRMVINGDYNFNGDPWPQVSQTAKDFVKELLQVSPEKRLTSDKALKHPWIINYSNQSSKNLHRSISQNLLKRASSRNSNKSAQSGRSSKSNRSLRSQHRKVKAKELDDLLKKYNYKP